MEKRYQVCISSNYTKLGEDCRNVMEGLLEVGCFSSGAEIFPVDNDKQFGFIKTIIDRSDYYLLIIGGCLGEVDEEGVSFIEKEFDYAVEKGIPTLVLINSEPEALPIFDKDQDKVKKLENLKNKAKTAKLKGFWSGGDELKSEIIKLLKEAFIIAPQSGWIKASEIQKLVKNIGVNESKSTLDKKPYVNEAKEYFHLKGIKIKDIYSEKVGTDLASGIDELEEGRVLVFIPIDFNIINNPIWYYYNVKKQNWI